MKKTLKYTLLTLIWVLAISCEGFLDEKPVKSILVPSTLEDVRALLDNYTTLNENTLISFILSDDWMTPTSNWESLQPWEQNSYLWKTEIFGPLERSTDYSRLHRKIFFANNCLEILDKIESNSIQEENLRGEALFVRSLAFYQLAQLFLPHPQSSQATTFTIPVRFTANVSEKSELLNIVQVLTRVEQDLTLALELLPEKAGHPNRPDQRTANGLLSGLYLYMGNYEKALEAAQQVLEPNEGLMNYNELNSDSPYPFKLFNEETLYHGVTSSFSVTASSATYINEDLYGLYSDNDLRKELFFTLDGQGNALFKGSYLGDFNLFTGLSVSEILLNGAEAAFRTGKLEVGKALLTELATKRYLDLDLWKQETGNPDLLAVLEERRKELVFRGSRWADMKRLAAFGELKLPITREIGADSFMLMNETQFVLELPTLELELEGE